MDPRTLKYLPDRPILLQQQELNVHQIQQQYQRCLSFVHRSFMLKKKLSVQVQTK